MQTYIGTKLINASPMDRQTYNTLRGWKLPADECGTDEGYLVEYTDGGQANHSDYSGYISWSPKAVFEQSYHQSGDFSFGAAVTLLKLGKKVARKGWNGKNMFLILVESTQPVITEGSPYQARAGIQGEVTIDAHIDMFTAGGTMQPGWLASQADMLADDWCLVD